MQPKTKGKQDWAGAGVRIVAEPTERDLAKALRSRFAAVGAAVDAGTETAASPATVIVVLPRRTTAKGGPDRVRRAVQQLHRLARATGAGDDRLVVVQFGGGRFGGASTSAEIDTCCAAAFACSLHLERPDVCVRVLDFDPRVPARRLAESVVREAAGAEPFAAVGFTRDGKRWVPRVRVQQPAGYQPRPIAWGPDDVILVTGGAKGITAACALGLAEVIGARFALVGRSPEPADQADGSGEVAAVLRKFAAAGRVARYYSCDVADADAVARLVARVRADLGPVTAVVHGVGLNHPRRAESVSADDALREVSPKLLGALHLCRELAAAPPKLFVGMTSVIGVTGMPGNAWYAFSNEALDLTLRRFAAEHPRTAVQSVAYSVWGETGMAHRMNSVETLSRMGIDPIPTDEGVRRFVELFVADPGAQQVLVTARLGGLDTWPVDPTGPRPEFRFVERVVSCQPGVELVARTRLSVERDPYLADHDFRGSLLFPTVFGLEAMAQAAAVVTGQPAPEVVRIEDIALERPVVVDAPLPSDPSAGRQVGGKGTEIELRAVAAETTPEGETAVRVEVRTEQTGFAVAHFAATLVLGRPVAGPRTGHVPQGPPLDIEPLEDLYGGLLFQGPRFQRMGAVYELDGDHTVFASEARDHSACTADAFGGAGTPAGRTLLLGDPFLRDVLLQAGQLTIPQHTCLPIGIAKIERFRGAAEPGRRIVVAPFKVRNGNEYTAEVFAVDGEGRMLERLTGYRLRILEEQPGNPTAADLADPDRRDTQLIRAALAAAAPAADLPTLTVLNTRRLHGLPRHERHQRERPLIAAALQAWCAARGTDESDAAVDWLADGRPVFTGASPGLQLSLTHDDGCCLCAVGTGPQGVDILPLTGRAADEWAGLLGARHRPVLADLAGGDTPDEAGSRVWAAVEAVRKATQCAEVELTVADRRGDAVRFTASTDAGPVIVVTVPVRLTRGPRRLLAVVIPGPAATPPAPAGERAKTAALASAVSTQPPSDGGVPPFFHSVSVAQDGPGGRAVQELRFVVSFQEASTISRHVPAAQYLKWMGKMRELLLSVNAPALIEEIATGEWGLVTNWGDVHLHGELTSNDVVQLRFWADPSAERDSEILFYSEFWRLAGDGRWERVASAAQKATWVRLVGHGLVQAEPLPAELAAYLRRMGPREGNVPAGGEPADARPGLDRGELLFEAPAGPGGARELMTRTFDTTLEESNLVGNVYFASYFSWQRKMRDLFLHRIDPALHQGVGSGGEIICLQSRMDYLREAMPFDDIEVVMSLERLMACGATLRFDFYRRRPDGGREKLSTGRHEAAWVTRGAGRRPQPTPWPTAVRAALEGATAPPPHLAAPALPSAQQPLALPPV